MWRVQKKCAEMHKRTHSENGIEFDDKAPVVDGLCVCVCAVFGH